MPSHERMIQLPGLSDVEIYGVVEKTIDSFLKRANLGNYDLQKNAEKKEFRIESKMVKGTLRCSASELCLDLNLSFLALPFKGALDEGIDRWVAKNFPNRP